MKSYEQLIDEVIFYNDKLDNPEIPPHSSNLLHQLNRREAKKLQFYNDICHLYGQFRKSTLEEMTDMKSYLRKVVSSTNEYMDFFRYNNPFSHQVDFTSSIIPEMFFLIMYRVITDLNLDYIVSAQSEVPIECMFDLQAGGRLMYKSKRLDLVVCKKTIIKLDAKKYDFIIPIVAMEMKTNLDKNMMSGIEHSVAALKNTFPNCLYYVVTELSDMAIDKLNYASSDINEIYIIRKQKRASIRSKKEERHLIDFDLIYEIVTQCKNQLTIVDNVRDTINERMHTGKLIN